MLSEKTNDIIYELTCFSVNMLLIQKKEDVIPEIQSVVRRISGLFEDMNL